MISLATVSPPGCLATFPTRSPLPEFKADDFQSCKRQIRALLIENQYHQCAYCEVPIVRKPGSFHLDHVESQSENIGRRFDITNLVAACLAPHTCGHGHGSASVPSELDPYRAPHLHRNFECHSDGELSAQGLSAAAESFALTPKDPNNPEEPTLNLNDPGLVSQREQVVKRLMQYTSALGTNARRNLKNLTTEGVGFRSLHCQYLGKFGFPEP